jgi:hypothetical protein
MHEEEKSKERGNRRAPGDVVGANGSPLTVADLPPSNLQRWTVARKAQVVIAVRCGLLSFDEACQRYSLSVEEFLCWEGAFIRYGVPGLGATRFRENRNKRT